MLEKVVLAQVFSHLNSPNCISNFQSAYHSGHSIETALLKVAKVLLTGMDTGKVSVLTLLDLSAAFDTVDHDILLHHLEHTFGFQGTGIAWFRSYLSDRIQTVSIDGKLSSPAIIHMRSSRVCTWANSFILYTQLLPCMIGRHPVSHQLYADDTQLYSPSEISATIHNMEKCICNVKSWMICNKFQMNNDKTEAILIATGLSLTTPFLYTRMS